MAVFHRSRSSLRLLLRHFRPSLLSLCLVSLVLFALRCLIPSIHQPSVCPTQHPPQHVFAALVTQHNAHHFLASLSALTAPPACVVHLYVPTDSDLAALAPLSNTCAFRRPSCPVRLILSAHAVHWAHLSLLDIPPHSIVILLRPTYSLSQPALHWLLRAQNYLLIQYARGATRSVAAFSIPCPSSFTPNSTCALSPVRTVPTTPLSLHQTTPEDTWHFFTTWFAARRREWQLWPHVWHNLPFVPNFWKGRSRAKRDARLIWFGHRMGTHPNWADDATIVFDMWFQRWVSNYSLQIIQVPNDTMHHFQHPHVLRDADGRKHITTARNDNDDVPLAPVWPSVDDKRFGIIYLQALKCIVESGAQTVSLTMVSSKFIELTRSWLCNVQRGGFVPDNIYWIVLDKISKKAMDATGIGQTVDLTDAINSGNMDIVNILYGQPSYWRLMLLRTRLIRDLLDRGLDVFLFETDQVWLQDPFKFIRRELHAGADMVGTLDTQHNIAGNTLLLRSVLPTRRMWREVYSRFLASYETNRIDTMSRHSETFVQHDQFQLSDLLMFNTEFRQDYPVALALLNSQLFVGGSWYSGFYSSEESKRPIIVNNNFISGTEKKKARAIIFGHWFLKRDNRSCDFLAIDRALRYNFLRLPGQWSVKELES